MHASSLPLWGNTDVVLAGIKDLHVHSFVVVSEAKQIIKEIHEGIMSNYGSIVREIKQRAINFNCKFIFEVRTSNKEADSLAESLNSLD